MKKKIKKIRQDYELPEAITKWKWKYHHIGIPTKKKVPGEIYLQKYKCYICGFDISPFGIEWMRFEKGSPIDKLIQKVPHIAFEVENLDYELKKLKKNKFRIITEPNPPSKGVRVAMIEHNGAPIELIEFKSKNKKGD